VEEYAKLFWEALSVEVFRSTDATLEELAVKAMRVFLQTLYPEPVASADGDVAMPDATPKLKGVVDELINNCTEEMKEADKSNAKSATKILGAAVSATRASISHADEG
jgi:DNA repair/transcription protein MET18/MMS19